jgi:hypothetical protein
LENLWDEVLETAEFFSKLPKADRIREHIRWAREEKCLSLDKLTSKEMFKSVATLKEL